MCTHAAPLLSSRTSHSARESRGYIEPTPYQGLSGGRPTAKWQYRQKLRQILRPIVRRRGSENASSLRAILLIANVLQAVHVAS
jgi:hypothetical protein